MKAVILCGGTGSRLKPLTEVRPKPLVKLLNVPVLEIIIDRLKNAGIEDIYISLGFMAQDIISECENMNTDLNLHYCEEAKPLGTAGGVKNCIKETDEDILIVSGDNIFDIDLAKAFDYHGRNEADFTVIGKNVSDPREYGCIVKDCENNISSFIEKPSWENAESFLINTGMYIMSGKLLSLIPENRFFDFAENLFPMLTNGKYKFICCETDGFWGDMGEIPAYLSLSKEILSDYTEKFKTAGTLILHDETDEYGNTFIAPCIIGGGTVFGEKCKIGPFAVIGKNVTVGDRCNIENSIIGDNSLIEDTSDITGAVIDDSVNIHACCVIEKNAVVGYGADIGKFSRLSADVKIWPGKTIISESVISRDMFYETPANLEFDIFGISGKAYSQFTLSDAVKIGQALASLKGISRIGVSCDGKSTSSVYMGLLSSGIMSCGVACYDFEESFMSQTYFYAAYCELDAFIFVSVNDNTVNLCFFGKNGMPLNASKARMVNNNFRFSSFSFAEPEKTGILYKMSPLCTAYTCALRKILTKQFDDLTVVNECENRLIKSTLDGVFDVHSKNQSGRIQFLLNPLGTDMYCLENDKFYSSDKIRSVLCELEFASGNDVIIPENASQDIEKIAEKYGRKAVRVFESCVSECEFDKKDILNSLWNFDALFLCVKAVQVLREADMSMEELCSVQNDFSVRSKMLELDTSPSKVKNIIINLLDGKKKNSSVYYSIPSSGGNVVVRQLGNTNRIRMLVEAADTETAKDIMTGITAKFADGCIDNSVFK